MSSELTDAVSAFGLFPAPWLSDHFQKAAGRRGLILCSIDGLQLATVLCCKGYAKHSKRITKPQLVKKA